jgi:hypothetical protein
MPPAGAQPGADPGGHFETLRPIRTTDALADKNQSSRPKGYKFLFYSFLAKIFYSFYQLKNKV